MLRQTETVDGVVTKTISYVIGHQRISQTISENGAEQEYFFTFDGHGSTRVLLNAAGAVAQLYSFDAYGNALGFNPSESLTEFLYSGEQFDSKIGQQYLHQRYYDSVTGRFNRLDPFFGNLNDPQSLHKYLYTHADPVNGVDPSGMFSVGGLVGNIGSMIRISANVLNVAQKDYTLFDNFQTAWQTIQRIQAFGSFASQFAIASSSGVNFFTAFTTALQSSFKISPSDIFNFSSAFNYAFEFIDDEWNELYKGLLDKADDIAYQLSTNPSIMRTTLSHGREGRNVALVINLPSPPEMTQAGMPLFQVPWHGIKQITLNVTGMNVGLRSDKRRGRLFGFEWQPNNRTNDHYGLERIDYQDFENHTYQYSPYYHIADNYPQHYTFYCHGTQICHHR